MNNTIDPIRLEALAKELADLSREIETQQRLLDSKVNSALNSASGYHEEYVRSAVSRARDSQQKVKNQARAISTELNNKSRSVRNAAQEYRRSEERIMRALNTPLGNDFLQSPATFVSATSSMNMQDVHQGLSTEDHHRGELVSGFQYVAEGGLQIGASKAAWHQLSGRYKYLSSNGKSIVNPNTLSLGKQIARAKGYSAVKEAFPGINPGASSVDYFKVGQKAGVRGLKSAFTGSVLKRNAALAGLGIVMDVHDDVTQLKTMGADKHTIGAAVITGTAFGAGVSAISIGAGAAAGGAAGAAAGAAFGSVIPIAGTIVGAAVGLLVGVGISLFLDKGIAELRIKDRARDALAENMRENEGREPYYLYRDR